MGSAKKRWNLVIITADDLNADSAGWMGSKAGATPNIDALFGLIRLYARVRGLYPDDSAAPMTRDP